MNQDPTDKTVLLSPRYQWSQKRSDNLEDTQPLPIVSESRPIDPPFPQTRGNGENSFGKDDKRNKRSSKKKKFFLLLVGFIAAVLIGTLIFSSLHTSRDKETAYQDQQQALDDKEKDYETELRDLNKKREQLLREQQELREKEKSLQESKSFLSGKLDSITAEQEDSSTAQKLMDKVTGKEKKRQQEADSIQQASNAKDSELDSLKKAMENSENSLDTIEINIQRVKGLKSEAESIRNKIEQSYQNSDTGALSSALQGAKILLQSVQNFIGN